MIHFNSFELSLLIRNWLNDNLINLNVSDAVINILVNRIKEAHRNEIDRVQSNALAGMDEQGACLDQHDYNLPWEFKNDL